MPLPQIKETAVLSPGAFGLSLGILVMFAAALLAAAPARGASARCGGMAATIIGTEAADLLHGTEQADVIVGFGGDDVIYGLGGDDVVCGGPGQDEIHGGEGNDDLRGHRSSDVLSGGQGDDRIDGGKGKDLVTYQDEAGPITLDLESDTASGAGQDTLISVLNAVGSSAADTMTASDEGSKLLGGPGADMLLGGDSADLLRGESGNDFVRGGAGEDYLYGGSGNDHIEGDRGMDTASGDSGRDNCEAESEVLCEHTVCDISPGSPQGTRSLVAGTKPVSGTGKVYTLSIAIEDGVDIDPACFARSVEDVLWDARSWVGTGDVALQRIETAGANAQIILASPDLTDALCAPLNTGGQLSCRTGAKIVINAKRWRLGVSQFGGDLQKYQQYLLNHEVGHRFGQRHRNCPGTGQKAPVMMQQSKSVGACLPNGWPLESERSKLGQDPVDYHMTGFDLE